MSFPTAFSVRPSTFASRLLVGTLVAVLSTGGARAAEPAAAAPPGTAPTKPKVEPRRVAGAHILVTYKELERTPPGVTRTREEAQTRAREAMEKARKAEAPWDDLVKEYSDDPRGASTSARGQEILRVIVVAQARQGQPVI